MALPARRHAFAKSILATLLFSSAPAWASITAGPYLQQVTQTSIRVMWQTSTATTDTLRYGPTTAYGQTLSDSSAVTLHSQVISGLSAGSYYYYQVDDAGITREGHFGTAPRPGADLVFAAFGDSRSSPSASTAIANGVAKFSPQLVLMSGDYTDSASSVSAWQSQFFTPAAALLANVPVVPAVGNHDSETGYPATQMWNYFPRPASTNYYSFDFGDLHVAVVDSNLPYSSTSSQYAWLNADLAATAQPIILVTHHYPVYSSGDHGSTADMDSTLRPLYEKYKVTAVINGHDHLYERSVRNGIPYFVLGGGGAPLYSATSTTNPYEVTGESTYNFGIFTLKSGALSMTAYRQDGSVIETVALTDGPVASPTPDPTPSPTPTPPGDGSGGCSGQVAIGPRGATLPVALAGLIYLGLRRRKTQR